MQLVGGAGLVATSSRTARPAPVFRPTEAGGAAELLAAFERAVAVAGGTDLCARFNEGLEPQALIALDRVTELRDISVGAGELRIGSCVTHAMGCAHPLIQGHLPGFAAAWRQISNVRVRFWATIGGNLMARRTRYEMSLLLTALDARLCFLDAGGHLQDHVPADVWADTIPPKSLLRHIAIPLRGDLHFHYDRTLRPVATLALRRDETGAVAVLATEHLPPVALTLDRAATPAAAAVAAFDRLPADFADAKASNWYLRRAGTTLLRRALETSGSVA